jgi:hypothetical protein
MLTFKDKLILAQNLLARATEVAIAAKGKDVTVAEVDKLLTEFSALMGRRIKNMGD